MDVLFSWWMPLESCLPVPNYLKQLPKAASRLKPLWSIHSNTQHYHRLLSRERDCFCACQENSSCCIHWPPRKLGCLAIVHEIFPRGTLADEPSGTKEQWLYSALCSPWQGLHHLLKYHHQQVHIHNAYRKHFISQKQL